MTDHPRFSGPGARIVRRWALFVACFIWPPLILIAVPLEVALTVRRRKKVRT